MKTISSQENLWKFLRKVKCHWYLNQDDSSPSLHNYARQSLLLNLARQRLHSRRLLSTPEAPFGVFLLETEGYQCFYLVPTISCWDCLNGVQFKGRSALFPPAITDFRNCLFKGARIWLDKLINQFVPRGIVEKDREISW